MTTAPKNDRRFGKIQYKPLEDDDASSTNSEAHKPRGWIDYYKTFTTAVFFAAIIIFIVALATFLVFGIQHTKSAEEIEDEEWNHCGRSSTDAKGRGCVMEPMFYGWMPSQCVFRELSDEFPVFENRKWYLDVNLTQQLPSQDLWDGKNLMVYTKRYHGEHCLFQWRKLQYGIVNRKEFLDNKTISIHHSKHCADQLSVRCETDKDWNEVELGFYRCRKTIW